MKLYNVIPFILLFLFLALLIRISQGADITIPSIQMTNFAEGTSGTFVNSNTYLTETEINITNAFLYYGTNTNTSIKLDAKTILVTVGSYSTQNVFTGTANSTNGGIFWSRIRFPRNMTEGLIEVKVTDTNTGHAIFFPTKKVYLRDVL